MTAEAYSEAVIEAGAALCRRARGFAPFAPVTDDPFDPFAPNFDPFAPVTDEAPRAARTPAAPMTDEDFELAEARVIAADAALADARAFVTSALRKGAAHLEADFVAVVADTEAARRAACYAERQRDVCEGEADELGPEAFAEAFAVVAGKLISAHLALLNLSLRESRFVADALSSLE